MAPITPRTCFWPLVGSVCIAFALSIGLTYRSNHHCYAGTCGEWLFPFQARIHVVVWYLWIALSITVFGLRAFQPSLRRLLSTPLSTLTRLTGRQVTLGPVILTLWVAGLYGILIGNWWIRLHDYFQERGVGLPRRSNNVVAAIALTGHLADVTMGMVLLPVARHSALASFFKLSVDATYTFHMTQAYVLFGLVLTHGVLYAAWAAAYNQNPSLFRQILPVLNPTYLYEEVWPGNTSPLGIWRASLIFTGIASSLIMVAIFCTSFPTTRQRHFNLFYFTHLLGIVAVVIICLHASTMLYCTLPGLMMWLLDWGMRFSELRNKIDSRISSLGNGWYTLAVPLPRDRIKGCSCDSPLAHFYIHHSGSSIREIHPFTTITHLSTKTIAISAGAPTITIQFLFRQSVLSINDAQGPSQPPLKKSTQWTKRLGAIVDQEAAAGGKEVDSKSITNSYTASTEIADVLSEGAGGAKVKVRLEGPYFTPARPETFRTVVCLVAGTGLSGALAIAAAFKAQKNRLKCSQSKSPGDSPDAPCSGAKGVPGRWQRCIVIWTVRDTDFVEMPFFSELVCEGFELRIHKTGGGRGRPDMKQALGEICGDDGGDTWCYLSGPEGFLGNMERACGGVRGLTWYCARWA